MKSILRSLVLVTLLVSGFVAQAAITNITVLGKTTNLVLAGNYLISKICINAVDITDIFTFYDGPAAVNTYTNASYTNVTRYATNSVTTITNSVGVVQTNHVNAVYTLLSVTAANTNVFPSIFVGSSIVANAEVCSDVNLIVTRGLVLGLPAGNTNTNHVTITYTRSF